VWCEDRRWTAAAPNVLAAPVVSISRRQRVLQVFLNLRAEFPRFVVHVSDVDWVYCVVSK
jgi:hypothetical protein